MTAQSDAPLRFRHATLSEKVDGTLTGTRDHLIHAQLSGAVQCEARDETGSRPVRLGPGEIALLPAGAWRHWAWRGRRQSSLVLLLSASWLAEFGAERIGCDQAPVITTAIGRHDALIVELARMLLHEASTPAGAALIGSAACMLGVQLLRSYRVDMQPPAPARGGLAAWQIRRIQAAVESQPNRNFSLAELAELVGLSPTHVCTAFRESTGLPPHRWQMQRRVVRAQELLQQRSLSLSEIALIAGYGSSSHFSTSFRNATGMSPTEYRRCRT
ncbi:MAG TPA: AraC family transcriptional regulator [Acetobacteraceae bacterium]|nr:AraC family transcriptional regulator [Acetobacteraceae bacterium]